MSTSAAELRAGLRSSLTSAMKARDKPAVAALRSALGAVDNAEAVDAASTPAPTSGVIAGAVVGLGAGEVARRELSADDIVGIVEREAVERETAAEEYDELGQSEHAASVRAEAAALRRWLATVAR